MRALILLCALAIPLAACSKKAGDATKPATGATAATKQPARAAPAARLVGAWKVDLAALAQTPDVAALDEATRARTLQIATKHLADLRFEFGADGAFSVTFANAKQTGRYEVAKAAGDTLTLKTTQQKGAELKTDEVQARFVGDRIVLTGPDGKPITFEAVK